MNEPDDDSNSDADSNRSLAAKKAWLTIRKKEIERRARENRSLEFYRFYPDMSKVSYGRYEIKPPLIRPSKLTYEDKGVGKELSDGYALNFAVGCTHACRFCYVDSIHKRFTLARLNSSIRDSNNTTATATAVITTTTTTAPAFTAADIITRSWGMYMLIPTEESFEHALKKTPWRRWRGKEVMLSSTHDPYLPELAKMTRRILEVSLPHGVRYCIQTRSLLVRNDFDLLERYREQVRLQVSIATMNSELSRLIEPRVPPAHARLNLLREAKLKGLTTGVIIAPIMPVEGWLADLESIFRELSRMGGVDHVYGEALHVRGTNLGYIEEVINMSSNNNSSNSNNSNGNGNNNSSSGSNINFLFELSRKNLMRFDRLAGKHFEALLHRYSMKGRYWYEH